MNKQKNELFGCLAIILGLIGILLGVASFIAGQGSSYTFPDPFMQFTGVVGILSFLCAILGGFLIIQGNKNGVKLLLIGGFISFILIYEENLNSIGFLLHMICTLGCIGMGFLAFSQFE